MYAHLLQVRNLAHQRKGCVRNPARPEASQAVMLARGAVGSPFHTYPTSISTGPLQGTASTTKRGVCGTGLPRTTAPCRAHPIPAHRLPAHVCPPARQFLSPRAPAAPRLDPSPCAGPFPSPTSGHPPCIPATPLWAMDNREMQASSRAACISQLSMAHASTTPKAAEAWGGVGLAAAVILGVAACAAVSLVLPLCVHCLADRESLLSFPLAFSSIHP
jgi:hypothetical protein